MKNYSVWLDYQPTSKIQFLTHDERVDVAIIGGGITGLSLAYFLKDTPLKVCLFEQQHIGESVTARSTAKITYLQDNILQKITRATGKKTAQAYYNSQKLAIKTLVNIINQEKIDCDLLCVPSYLYTNEEKEIAKIKNEAKLLKSFGEEIETVTALPDSPCLYGIRGNDTYVFHPLKYLHGLKQAIQDQIAIYEESRVVSIEKNNDCYDLVVNNCHVLAKKVIVCTHYPSFLFPYLMPLKCSLEKSYIALYPSSQDYAYSAITSEYPPTSIRFVGANKLVLQESHNINFSFDDRGHFQKLLALGKPTYLWSNIDIMTKDYIPYIGMIKDNLYLATGYNTWGMTNGTLAGLIIKDLLLNSPNIYHSLVDPYRVTKFQTFCKYPIYASSSVYALLLASIPQNKKSLSLTKHDGHRLAIYYDKAGNSHKVYQKCPHLGCNLIYNEIEQTWDCPCHGSRFSLDGHCICGPSNKDITYQRDTK